MTSIKEQVLDFSDFSSVQDCREFVDKLDRERFFITLRNWHDISDEYYLPLIDRWLKDSFAGRVFLEEKADRVTELGQLIKDRISPKDPKICWRGLLYYSEKGCAPISILNPVRPDRIPVSEKLFSLGSVTDEQISEIGMSSGKPVGCEIDESLIELNNMVIISMSESDTRLYLLQRIGSRYTLHPVQSPSTFSEVYKSAVETVGRLGRIDKATYLRALTVSKDKIGSANFSVIETKKHLNVLRTIERVRETIFPFFEELKSEKKSTEKDENFNFENSFINKKINKMTEINQTKINELLKQQASATSVEEMVYSGKRFRRLVGTHYHSHKYTRGKVISNDQLVEGLLASEYIGEIGYSN